MIERWQVLFSGQVQGVGFRYTAQQVAKSCSLDTQFGFSSITGWIRNLSDGRVELMVEGSSEQLRGFVQEVSETTHGRVTNTEIERFPPTGEFSEFEIRR